MATELRRWIGGTLAACFLAAVGLVAGGGALAPPRDQPSPTGSRWTAEAARLAGVWRNTWGRWRLESYRNELARPVDSARAAGGSAPLLMIDGPSTPAQRTELNRYLAEMWRQAAPEGFKVAVALVIVRDTASQAGPDTPTLGRGDAPTYLFPDSLHRDMCLAVIHEGFMGRRLFSAHHFDNDSTSLFRWLMGGIGPCAFYGAYGIPGREIGRWMNGQGFQFAMFPEWWSKEPVGTFFYWDRNLPPSRQPTNWWVYTYSTLPWNGVACYAGRRAQCGANVFDSAAVADSQPSTWNASEWWREQPFLQGVRFLSDVSRSVGTERFSEFWSADVPMDSAFRRATGRTLADWTADWARGNGPPLQVGPSAPPLDILFGLLPAALALGAALWYARRRQIG